MKDIIKNVIYIARRFKLATALNMVGLIVAFTAFYLLMTQVIYQATYNHSIEDYDRLYRMESDFTYNEWEFSNLVCIPFAEALGNLPEVESYSLIYNPGIEEYLTGVFLKGDQEVTYPVTEGNNTAISTLTNKAVSGSIEWTDSTKLGAIIPESIAIKHFGTADAAGMTLTMLYNNEPYNYEVRGVYKDFPSNCELNTNRILFHYFEGGKFELNSGYQCIVKFKTIPKDLDAFAQKVKQTVIDHMTDGLRSIGQEDKIATTTDELKLTNFKFIPLKNSYFEYTSFHPGTRGFKLMFHILWLTCLLVILIAAINFLNFTLAESPMRIRGLNTRLVLGATRDSLKRGIVGEGIVISLTACVIALIVCRLLQLIPVINKLTEGSLALENHWMLIMVMLVLAVIVGIAASVYPGTYATSIPPAIALKGSFGLTPQGIRLRKVLTGIQLFISLFMIIYLGFLYQQSRFIFNSEYGYNRDGILLAALPVSYDYTHDNDSLYHAIKPIPGVENVSFSEGRLGQVDGYNTVWTSQHGRTFKYSLMHVCRDYLTNMGIKIIEGRNFNATDTLAVIINQATCDSLPWIKPGTVISTSISDEEPDSAIVVGVCENIRYGSTRIGTGQPFVLVFKDGYNFLNSMIVHVSPQSDHKAIQQQVNDLLKEKYKSKDVEAQYFDTMLEQTYQNELRFTNQMVLICFICQIITLIGVFCLTLFEIEYRRKEIGIRKVMGAKTSEIMWLMMRHYIPYLLIAFAIAAPLAGWLGYKTLDYFKQHELPNWWIFPIALLLVGGVVLGTVALQSWRASRQNPVKSIENE